MPNVRFDDLLEIAEETLGNVQNCLSVDVTEIVKRGRRNCEDKVKQLQDLVDKAKGIIFLRGEAAFIKTKKPVFIIDIEDGKGGDFRWKYFYQVINHSTITEGNYAYILPAVRQGLQEFARHIDEYKNGKLRYEPEEYEHSKYALGEKRVARLVLK